MKSERMLAVVIVLQVMILAGQWLGQPNVPAARAEIFNPSVLQVELVDQAKSTNAKLDKLISVLQSGDMQVKIAKEEQKN